MNDIQVLIEQMVSDMCSQAVRLDDIRLPSFLSWWGEHGSKVKAIKDSCDQVGEQIQMKIAFHQEGNMEEHLKTGLITWFESLPMPDVLWEYHLILYEIPWWRDLEAGRLTILLRFEDGY